MAARRWAENVKLEALAYEAGLSPFHVHRLFSAVVAERPKQFTTRLRMSSAAALLLTGRAPVLRIALECGFESHEGFIRAFRRHFGTTPSAYRERGFAAPVTAEQRAQHAHLVDGVSPCIGLYHIPTDGIRRRSVVSYTITKRELAPQPVLIGRKRVTPEQIADAIGQVLSRVFQHAEQAGIAISGRPFARYSDMSMGSMTIEPGMPVVAHPAAGADSADGEVSADTFPGGTVATTIHAGAYEKLREAYSALERWMEANGHTPAGSPWESYLTDPAEHADPAEWRTEVFWPIR
jgi:AraC family transcriptional regulator